MEGQIEEVGRQILTVSEQFNKAFGEGNEEYIRIFSKKEEQLRKKEEQLRKKEEQLRKKEEQLRKEKEQLRTEAREGVYLLTCLLLC